MFLEAGLVLKAGLVYIQDNVKNALDGEHLHHGGREGQEKGEGVAF